MVRCRGDVPAGHRFASLTWPGDLDPRVRWRHGDDMREQADWLAAAGYLALVPDLYNGRSMVRCIKSNATQLMAQQGPIFG